MCRVWVHSTVHRRATRPDDRPNAVSDGWRAIRRWVDVLVTSSGVGRHTTTSDIRHPTSDDIRRRGGVRRRFRCGCGCACGFAHASHRARRRAPPTDDRRPKTDERPQRTHPSGYFAVADRGGGRAGRRTAERRWGRTRARGRRGVWV